MEILMALVPVIIIGGMIWFFLQWNSLGAAHQAERERLQKLADEQRPILLVRAEELHQMRLREVSLKESDLALRQQEVADRQDERVARQSEADRTFELRKQSDAQTSALQRLTAVSQLAVNKRKVALDDLRIIKEGGTPPSLQVPDDLVAPTLIVEEALPSPEAIELEQEVFNIVVDNREIVLTYVPALKMGCYSGAVNRDFFECSKEQLAQEAMAKAMSL